MNKFSRLITTALMTFGIALPCNSFRSLKADLLENGFTQNAYADNGFRYWNNGGSSDYSNWTSVSANETNVVTDEDVLFYYPNSSNTFDTNTTLTKNLYTGLKDIYYREVPILLKPNYFYKIDWTLNICALAMYKDYAVATYDSETNTLTYGSADNTQSILIDTSKMANIIIGAGTSVNNITNIFARYTLKVSSGRVSIQQVVQTWSSPFNAFYAMNMNGLENEHIYLFLVNQGVISYRSLENVIQTCQVRLEDITKTWTDSDNDSAESEYNSMQEQLNEQSSQITDYENQIENLWAIAKAERSQLESEIETYNNEYAYQDSMKFTLKFSTTEESSLSDFVNETQSYYNELVTKYNSSILSYKNDISTLQTKVNQLTLQLATANNTLERIAEQVSNMKIEYTNLYLNSGGSTSAVQLYEQTAKSKGLSTDIETQLYYLELLLNGLNDLVTSSTDTQIQQLQSNIADLNKSLTEYTEKYVTAKNNYDETKQELDKANKTIAQLQAQVNSLEEQLNDNDYSFTKLFWGIANTPITFLNGWLNFDLLGVNIFGVVTAIFTALLCIAVIKKLI